MLFVHNRKRSFAQTGLIDETFDLDEGMACDAVWHNYMKLLKLGQECEHRYNNKCKVTFINIDGNMLIGRNTVLMNNGNVAQRSDQIDSVLDLFIVLDSEPNDQHKPEFQDVFGKVTENHGFKVDLHVRNDMFSRFRELMREKIVVKGCNEGV